MKWSETESAFLIYKHYLDMLISNGKVVISSTKADSLGHILRGVIKGCKVRNHVPYSSLRDFTMVKVGVDEVTLIRKAGAPAIYPISEREYRILAPTTYNEVLATIGRITNGELDKAAFLSVSDLDATKISYIQKICSDAGYTCNATNQTVVIIK